jgi:hypothetical protein
MSKHISFQISDRLFNDLESAMVERDTTKSEIIRQSIRDNLYGQTRIEKILEEQNSLLLDIEDEVVALKGMMRK